MSFNGKWTIIDGSGIEGYFDAIKSSEEHKQQLRGLLAMTKQNPGAYVEELVVTPTSYQRIIRIGGEIKKDSGPIPFGVEQDSVSGDGRPAKVKYEKNSDTKLTRYETGDGFSTVATFELDGDVQTITATGNGATMVTKYKRV